MQLATRRKVLSLALLCAMEEDNEERARGRGRLHWVHPINQQRQEQGDFHHLVAELQLDNKKHHRYFRMSADQLDHLLSVIGPELTRQTTNFRAPIDPKQRLAVALR